MARYFVSDNASGVHPTLLQAIIDANHEHAVGYGEDPLTKETEQLLREVLEAPHAQVAFCATGTAANVIAIGTVLSPHEAVLCANSSHLYWHECGAPERFLGAKLIPIPTENGKIAAQQVEEYLLGRGSVHYAQPRVVSISQCTEWGTLYTLEEVVELAACCRKHDLLLHMDGARLPLAATALGCSLAQLTTHSGVDLLSFGGTKCGAMMAEAALILREGLGATLPFRRKQATHLLSKMRYVSAQFRALLTNELWREIASSSLSKAKELEQMLLPLPDVTLVQPVETNALFIALPAQEVAPLLQEVPLVLWDKERGIVRLLTSFDTTSKEIEAFVNRLSFQEVS